MPDLVFSIPAEGDPDPLPHLTECYNCRLQHWSDEPHECPPLWDCRRMVNGLESRSHAYALTAHAAAGWYVLNRCVIPMEQKDGSEEVAVRGGRYTFEVEVRKHEKIGGKYPPWQSWLVDVWIGFTVNVSPTRWTRIKKNDGKI